MRAFTLAVLAAGVLAAVPITASAATIVEDFEADFPEATGESGGGGRFPQFDPKLGTLQEVSISVVGSLTLFPKSTPAGVNLLLFDALADIQQFRPKASQLVSTDSTDPQTVSVSLSFEEWDLSILEQDLQGYRLTE